VIYPARSKLSVIVAVASLMCGLVVGGCSNHDSDARRLGSNRSPRMLRPPGMRQNMSIPNFTPASPADVRIAKELIRNHLHAFGRSDFNTAFNLLTKEFRGAQGEESRLRFTVSTFFRDFLQVKKVRWNRFVKDADSRIIDVSLDIEARNGNTTRVYYRLSPENGRYLVAGIQSPPSRRFRTGRDPRESLQDQMEEKMFSGVLYSPGSRHRVLDSSMASS
jgi:hypothetical protein